MSKFITKLERIWKGKAQPIGFGVQAKAKSPPMAVIAIIPQGEPQRAALAVETGVDALLIPIETLNEQGKALSQVISAAGNIPWGVWIKGVSKGDIKWLIERGCDFLVFSADEVPAVLLVEEGIGKVLEVEPSLSDSLVRTIALLPIDAVLLTENEPLTIRRLMDYERLASLGNKPLLLALPSRISEGDLEGLWEAGVRGVVVRAEQQILSQVKEAIQALPLKKVKAKVDVTLPIVTESPGELEEEI
jgi:hypothetical protein